MLRVILDRGNDVAIPTESMILGDFAHVRAGSMDLSRYRNLEKFTRLVWNHPKVKLWNLPGTAPTPPRDLSHDEAYRWAIEVPYRAFAAAEKKSRWGDKTPYYIEWIDEIVAVWPNAKFVELVRDGRDVALSIIPLPFGGNNVWVAGRDWANGIREGLRAHRNHPENILTVRYEALVSEPEGEVRRICDFLDLEFHPEMLNINETPEHKVVADQKEWFSKLWGGISTSSVGKWRKSMSPRDQNVFFEVAGKELLAHDYDAGAGEATGSTTIRARGYTASNFSKRLVNLVKLRIVQERGRELRYVAQRRWQRLRTGTLRKRRS